MTEHELIEQINLKLEIDGQEVKKARSEEQALIDGNYFIDEVNLDRQDEEETPRTDLVIVRRDVNLEALAREMGVLGPEDEIEYPDGEDQD